MGQEQDNPMRDFLGRTLRVDDEVVVKYFHGSGSSSTNHSLAKAVVVGFTPKKVRWTPPEGPSRYHPKGRLSFPNDILKVQHHGVWRDADQGH